MKPTTPGDLIFSLQKKIDDVLCPLIPRRTNCALIDFPAYPNAGDSAIWLGERKWLKNNENQIVYICDKHTYSKDILSLKIGNGIILLQGGGNFGDLWKDHQRFREKVITDFPANKIIQLPQTIFFSSNSNIKLSQKILNKHPDLTLLCRDTETLNLTQNEFTTKNILCPDMAFVLGFVERQSLPKTDIVWLLRTDKETVNSIGPSNQPGVERVDWLQEPNINLHNQYQTLCAAAKLDYKNWEKLYPSISDICDIQAEERFINGCKILSNGKVVVTDRLHGHIISILLNIPHIVLDNNYGKIKGFYKTWTAENDLTAWADNPKDAINSSFSSSAFSHTLKSRGIDLENTLTGLKKSINNRAGWTTAQEDVNLRWENQLRQLKEQLLPLLSRDHRLILVDEDLIRGELGLGDKSIIPFIEYQQQYWGTPHNDEMAITEIERLKKLKTNYIVFAWPSFWMLDHYKQMNDYLVNNYECIKRNEDCVIFNLQNTVQ